MIRLLDCSVKDDCGEDNSEGTNTAVGSDFGGMRGLYLGESVANAISKDTCSLLSVCGKGGGVCAGESIGTGWSTEGNGIVPREDWLRRWGLHLRGSVQCF